MTSRRPSVTLVALLAAAFVAAFSSVAAFAEDPTEVVHRGVTNFTLAGFGLFWHGAAPCDPSSKTAGLEPVFIDRLASREIAMGGVPGNVRVLYLADPPRGGSECNPAQLLSNIAADLDYVYFVDSSSWLVRQSRNATYTDAPEHLFLVKTGRGLAEVAVTNKRVYVLSNYRDQSGPLVVDGSQIASINKFDRSDIQTLPIKATAMLRSLKVQEPFIYWMELLTLHRVYQPDGSELVLATNVTGYAPDRSSPNPMCATCRPIGSALIAHATFLDKQVEVSPGVQRLFTTTTPFNTIYDVDNDVDNMEDRALTGFAAGHLHGPVDARTEYGKFIFISASELEASFGLHRRIWRISYPGKGTVRDLIHDSTRGEEIGETVAADGFLFWSTKGTSTGPNDRGILRLSQNAEPISESSLSTTNMAVTGIELTQGIHSRRPGVEEIPLIRGRRTFVRVYVRSEGLDVADVGAVLYATTGGTTQALQPTNPVGKRITVARSPSRDNLDQSFLFELPLWMTRTNDLVLQAELNPDRAPRELVVGNPTLGHRDNYSEEVRPVFQVPAYLPVALISFRYIVDGKIGIAYPDDETNAELAIAATYPVNSYDELSANPGGLHFTSLVVRNDTVGNAIVNPGGDCGNDGATNPPANACGCRTANAWIRDGLIDGDFEALAGRYFVHGLLPTIGGVVPRGCATATLGPVSSGDVNRGVVATAHELGHTLGFNHPNTDRAACGPEPTFELYPYSQSLLTPPPYDPELDYQGFDWRRLPDSAGSAPLLAGRYGYDMMSYCGSEGTNWISDVHYRKLFSILTQNYTINLPTAGVAPEIAVPRLILIGQPVEDARSSPATPRITVAGTIAPKQSKARIWHVRKLRTAGVARPTDGGPYALRLVGSGGGVLVSWPLNAFATEDAAGVLDFHVTLPFAAATRAIEVVDVATGNVLTSRGVSAHAPELSSVTATLIPPRRVDVAWEATDADGDPLRYDVLYSRDDGATYRGVAYGLDKKSLTIDDPGLGGGVARVQVVAADDALTTTRDSAPFTMPAAPPRPRILNPPDGTRTQWGQLLNLIGTAPDAQEGQVADARLAWRTQRRALGSGRELSIADLDVGTNTITLTATNAEGISAQASITVVVGDELAPLGPTLIAGPGALAWHADGSERTLQGYVTVGNAGEGELAFTAVTGAAWATAQPATAVAPARIQVRIDATGLAADVEHRTTLSLEPVDKSVAPVVIPITVAKGATWGQS